MTDDEIELRSSTWIEIDARSHKQSMFKTLQQLNQQTNLSVRNQWVKEAIDSEDWLVTSLQEEDYQLPTACIDFLGAELMADLKNTFLDIQKVNNEFAGMAVSLCEVMLAGDERVQTVNQHLSQWARSYVEVRILRSKHRREDEMQKYDRLYRELLPQLEKIAFRKGSVNRSFMAEFCDYLAWLLLNETVRKLVETKFDREELVPVFRINSSKPRNRAYLEHIVRLYQWQHDDDLSEVLRLLNDSSLNSDHFSEAEINIRTELLVSNIQEMRSFLVHNFKAENAIVEISKNVFFSWTWAVGRGLGLIHVAPSKEKMLALHRQRSSGVTFTLLFDGHIANYYSPWINTNTISTSDRTRVLLTNLRIVEAIHDALLALYEKIDINAVIARFKEKNKSVPAVEPTDEEFAALCQLIAETENEQPLAKQDASTRIKSVRVQRLLSILSEQLHCEIRQGKGSEIVIFRDGGHHFRLGHHKKNIYVPTTVIRNILKHVGIGSDEWFKAIC